MCAKRPGGGGGGGGGGDTASTRSPSVSTGDASRKKFWKPAGLFTTTPEVMASTCAWAGHFLPSAAATTLPDERTQLLHILHGMLERMGGGGGGRRRR